MYARGWQIVYALRRRIGVVFPLPVGLPLSVYDNVALAPASFQVYQVARAELDDSRRERCSDGGQPCGTR